MYMYTCIRQILVCVVDVNLKSSHMYTLFLTPPPLSILSSPYVLLSLMTLVVPHASNTAAILPKQRRAGQKK